MTTKTALFKKATTLLIGVFCLPLLLLASHFRYGSISWTNVSGNTVVFKISQAWRTSAFFGGTPPIGTVFAAGADFNFGDGTSVPVNLTVTSVNPAEDWLYAEMTVSHTYASPGSRIASASNCCRISTL